MAARSSPADRSDPAAGVTLVETVIAMLVMSVLVTAALPFIVGVLQSTTGLGAKQAALTVASQQLEYVRSLDPGNLITGRNATDVAALIASPGLVDLSSELTTTANSDPTAASGSANAVVKLTVNQTLNGTIFTVRTYIDVCYLSETTGMCSTSTANGSAAYRVSVDVAWPQGDGVNCLTGRVGYCEYVNTTLVDISDDPVFSTNTPPIITSLTQVNGGVTTPLTSLHPGQQVTAQLTGSNYAYGAVMYSASGDSVSSVTNTGAGTILQGTLIASSVLGTRSFSVVNTDGGSASTTFTVATSAPTVTAMSPASAARNTQVTFTLTGTDFFATPTTAAPTTKPTVTLAGSATISGVPTTISPATSSITVVSATSLTFKVTFPAAAVAYSTTGTLTLTNPDGGSTTYAYTKSIT